MLPGPELLHEIIGHGDKNSTCIIDGGYSFTYGQLGEKITNLASYLVHEYSIQKRERVILYLPNNWKFVVAFYAVLRAGGIVVPVDFRSSKRELDYISDNTQASIQFVDEIKRDSASNSCKETIIVSRGPNFYGSSEGFKPPEIKPEDTAVIFFTGGTTGFSKGVPLSHRNVMHMLSGLSGMLGLKYGKETFVQFLPMTHSGGMNCSMNTSLYNAGKTIIMSKFDPTVLLDIIEQQKVSVVIGVPTVYSSLVKSTDLRNRDLSSVRIFFLSGDKIHENVANEFRAMTGKTIVVGWGLTEASPQLSVAPPGKFKENYVGKPLPGTEIVTVDGEGNILPASSIGMLAVKGPQVMSGYWRNEEKNLEVFTSGGYLLTGDTGYVGEDGIYLLGRAKDVIISGGYKIWRTEVENTIMEHECVRETAVIGINDPIYGETVKAFIVSKCEITKTDIVAFCRARLSAYKVPRIIEFRSELPKSSIGKILHRVLEQENASRE
ncbi:MAG: AMP-binding protein [Thermoplasmatales archaeon]|nr:AMP-binding protein [Thermoplasmatales archaeon]